MSCIHPKTVYTFTRPGRIDPKFIGIAEQFMQHKQKRKEAEKQFKYVENSLLFAQKTNLSLSRSLEQKQKQLERLQKVRQRHEHDHEKKMQRNENKRRHLQQLRQKATFERKKLKSSIQQRMSELRNERKRQKNEIKSQSKVLEEQLSQNEEWLYQRNKKMYRTIKNSQQKGNQKVDEFYRQRNLLSLDNYQKSIEQENTKFNFYRTTAQRMNQTISVLEKSNNKKQKKLEKIEAKIEQLNPLKSFYSTRLRNEGFGLSRKDSKKSVSSKKPSQILLDRSLKNCCHDMNVCKINLSHKIKDNPEIDDFCS